VQPPPDSEKNVLDTVDGEIYFFRAIMRARPVGIHRHFHVMTMQRFIEKGIHQQVAIVDLWKKLESCYNLDALEALEGDYDSSNGSNSSTPQPAPSPSPEENLAAHPFFRSEFALPADPFIESLIVTRRMRTTASPPSSPEPAAPQGQKRKKPATPRGRKRGTSKAADLAGLVSGDSDSSALTQDSDAEEPPPQTPSERRASVVTGTDGGTEEAQDEEEDRGAEATPEPSETSKPKRGRKSGVGGRGRAASTAAGRPTRKRKKQ